MDEFVSSYKSLIAISALTGLTLCIFVYYRKKDEPKESNKTSSQANGVGTATKQDTSFIGKMKRTGKSIVCFYGSQTGTAEEFAIRLAKSATSYGLKGFAVDCEDADFNLLGRMREFENSIAVFCIATYGEGDPTDNAVDFNEWLKESMDDEEIRLDDLRYAVFGLGNKTYEQYNKMGIFVDECLQKMGAERVCELGLGDDDANIEDDFVQWQELFWKEVCSKFHLDSSAKFTSVRQYAMQLYDPTQEVPKLYTGEPARYLSYERQRPPFDQKNPFMASVKVNRKLNRGGDRYLMHLEVDIEGSKIRYESGDHVAVLPVNNSNLVEKLATLMDVDLDAVFALNNLDEDDTKKFPFPCPTTFRTAFTHYLDIDARPTTHILREFAEYATEDADKEFLKLLSENSPEGKKEYKRWIAEDHRGILSVLSDIPSLKVPIDHLCELLPRLIVRYYSISSSSKIHPTSIHITAVLVDYTTPIGNHVQGICTSFMKNLKAEEAKMPIFIRKSQFRLPMKSTSPVILIGPGTGLAPFRGFIQEKAWQKAQNKPIGEVVLFFGCRRKSEDYLYQEELEQYEADGVISNLFVAFSRDQNHKIYVQHLIKQNGKFLYDLLCKGGHIYICGDAKNMARDVLATLEALISEHGEMSLEKAQQYIKNLSNKGRYSTDVWS